MTFSDSKLHYFPTLKETLEFRKDIVGQTSDSLATLKDDLFINFNIENIFAINEFFDPETPYLSYIPILIEVNKSQLEDMLESNFFNKQDNSIKLIISYNDEIYDYKDDFLHKITKEILCKREL
jgi:hypothetical protein